MDKNQKPSKVESIKEESRYLRGNLKEGLADNSSHFNEEGYQLLKFHGIYQQDDRSQRQQLKREGKDKAWMFMVRLKLPGGVMSPEQYLVCDDLSSRFANSTLRLTTRQDIQFHGILKSGLKPTIRQLNEALITTFGACGDVERNVMACPAPGSERVRSDVLHYAQLLSDHLLPRTRAYHEIWLNGEKIESSEPDHEPLYGKYYLPRKFKTAIAYAEDNCVDVYSNDMGFIADFDGEKLRGFDVLVGGGLGMTHGNAATYPRLAIPLAYVAPDKLLETAETIICIQRDYGDRSNRKHARLKYLVQEWGIQRFKEEMERRLGYELAPPRPAPSMHVDDHLGWHPQGDGRWFLGVYVENGRVADWPEIHLRTAFRRLVEQFRLGVRITAQQNILFTDIAEKDRPQIERILADHGIPSLEELPNALRDSMACPALPTCGLAMSDAENALPEVVRALGREFARLGLEGERISIRMTGCPNGCARPYIGDIGFVGRTLNAYNIYLGGDFEGTRLNQLYADLVPKDKLVSTLIPILEYYKAQGQPGERLGDFCHRLGMERLRDLFPPPVVDRAARAVAIESE